MTLGKSTHYLFCAHLQVPTGQKAFLLCYLYLEEVRCSVLHSSLLYIPKRAFIYNLTRMYIRYDWSTFGKCQKWVWCEWYQWRWIDGWDMVVDWWWNTLDWSWWSIRIETCTWSDPRRTEFSMFDLTVHDTEVCHESLRFWRHQT